MQLTQIRNEIDALDEELCRILSKRMELTRMVGEQKRLSGGEIFVAQREKDILQNVPFQLRPIFAHIMRLSRAGQYSLAANALPCSKPIIEGDVKIAAQGIAGAYSHIAVHKMYAKEPHFFATFSDVFEAVEKGDYDLGVVPYENSTAGDVDEVYDLLVKHNLHIVKSFALKIEQYLCVLSGAKEEDIRCVISKEEALMQCRGIENLQKINAANTAIAARDVAAKGDITYAAVCSREAAERYGLVPLKKLSEAQNTTRFIVLAKHFSYNQNANRCSISFTLPHESGTLGAALSVISDFNLNLTSIHSRPIRGNAWNYHFFADIESAPDETLAVCLTMLTKELDCKILGIYSLEEV